MSNPIANCTACSIVKSTDETSTRGNAMAEYTIDEFESSPKSPIDCVCVCYVLSSDDTITVPDETMVEGIFVVTINT